VSLRRWRIGREQLRIDDVVINHDRGVEEAVAFRGYAGSNTAAVTLFCMMMQLRVW